MDTRNLKLLILGMLLGAILLAGGMVFNSLSNILRSIQIKYTEEGVLLKL
jgi:hypothetical protein